MNPEPFEYPGNCTAAFIGEVHAKIFIVLAIDVEFSSCQYFKQFLVVGTVEVESLVGTVF